MTNWNKQVLTKEQKESAAKRVAKYKKDNVGDQPYFVLDCKGKLVMDCPEAVCLGDLYSEYKHVPQHSGGLVLFQAIVLSHLDNGKPHGNLSCSDDVIINYVDNVVKLPIIRPWLCKHTKKERMAMGVPIALDNVPANAPLLASTWVRYMWDRHNNDQNITIPIIRELKPRWNWMKTILASQVFTGYKIDEISFGPFSRGHGLIGRARKSVFASLANNSFDVTKHMYRERFFFIKPLRGSGVERMFSCSRSFGEQLKDVLQEATRSIYFHERWGEKLYNKKQFPELLDVFNNALKGE